MNCIREIKPKAKLQTLDQFLNFSVSKAVNNAEYIIFYMSEIDFQKINSSIFKDIFYLLDFFLYSLILKNTKKVKQKFK